MHKYNEPQNCFIIHYICQEVEHVPLQPPGKFHSTSCNTYVMAFQSITMTMNWFKKKSYINLCCKYHLILIICIKHWRKTYLSFNKTFSTSILPRECLHRHMSLHPWSLNNWLWFPGVAISIQTVHIVDRYLYNTYILDTHIVFYIILCHMVFFWYFEVFITALPW